MNTKPKSSYAFESQRTENDDSAYDMIVALAEDLLIVF